MDRLRRMSQLATALAVLAIGLRILLPALHNHPPHFGGHATAPTAVACSCGVIHSSPATPADSRERVEESAPEIHACLACELEQGTPVDRPTDSGWQITHLARHGERNRDTPPVRARRPHTLARPRAPPSHQV